MSEIIALAPDDPGALASRGVLFGRLGERAPALADAEAALSMSDDADIVCQVGGIYALTSAKEEGDAERAVSLVARALKRKPSLVSLVVNDPDLSLLGEQPKYRALVAATQALQGFTVGDKAR